MIAIILTGGSCSGKTTAATYLSRHYNLAYINLRRYFEYVADRYKEVSVYQRQCTDSNKGKLYWLSLVKPYLDQTKKNDYVLIEGVNSIEEICWIGNNITDSLVVIYLRSEDRFQLFGDRYNFEKNDTYAHMSESDARENDSHQVLERISAYQINNSSDIESFYERLDLMMDQLLKMPILSCLCYDVNKTSSYSFSPIDLAYFIRQVGIAHGCRNACTHCFAESPYNVVQTELHGFSQFIKEIGLAVEIKGTPLRFFHLGASTDPAMVKGYTAYLSEWINAMPSFQIVKIFSHGWDLSSIDGKSELTDIIKYISSVDRDIRIVLSFDCFSISAKLNWEDYIKNIIENIKLILGCISKKRLRIEVFYPPERKEAPLVTLLDWWRKLALSGSVFEWDEVTESIQKNCDARDVCSKTTLGLMQIFRDCNLEFNDLVDMTRDCNMIFGAGRGLSFFKDKPKEYIDEGLSIQKQRVLYSLKDYEYGYNGLIVYPDGSIRFVDYEGYKLGQWIDGGKKVIKCMNIIKDSK